MILENKIKQASQLLKLHNIKSHNLDAQIILSDIMGVSKEFLLLNDNLNIKEKIAEKYKIAIKRRTKGEPVAYITGKREFWNDSFFVNRSTLVPRPETELLIYKILSYFKNRSINILDIGVGSGCILLSLLRELKTSRGIGIDICPKAINVAKINAKKLNLLNRIKLKVFDINKFDFGKYDLIVSNPPYIPSRDIKKLNQSITNYEPLGALNGGTDGLDLTKKVIYKSKILLKQKGLLAIEIGNRQYSRVLRLLCKHGFRELHKEYDYNKNVRCIISTKL